MIAATIEHKDLPEGEWWACERPECPPEPYVTHYRPGCPLCYPAWRARAEDPRATFFTAKDPTLKSLHRGHTEAELRAWWFEGIVSEPVG